MPQAECFESLIDIISLRHMEMIRKHLATAHYDTGDIMLDARLTNQIESGAYAKLIAKLIADLIEPSGRSSP